MGFRERASEADRNQVSSEVAAVFAKLKLPDPIGLPKYRRLEQAILECIRAGYWRSGDRLPAEDQLTGLTPYSLGTIQRAMRQLTADSIVERRHGDGSYVRGNMKAMDDPWHCRFIDVETDTILPISSRTLLREQAGSGPWSRYFDRDADLIRLDRQIMVNDEFLIYSRFYFDQNALGLLADVPLKELDGTNFRNLINEQSRLPITFIDRQISFSIFDAETRKVLGPEGGEEGLRLQAVARSGSHTTVFYQEFFIPKTVRPLALPDQQ